MLKETEGPPQKEVIVSDVLHPPVLHNKKTDPKRLSTCVLTWISKSEVPVSNDTSAH